MKHANWARNHFSPKTLKNLKSMGVVIVDAKAIPIKDSFKNTETGYIVQKRDNEGNPYRQTLKSIDLEKISESKYGKEE